MRRLLTAAFLLTAIVCCIPDADAQKTDPKKSDPKKAEPKKVDPKAPKVPAKEYPKEILGKDLEAWAKDIKDNRDPSVRELAIKTMPLFGPDCRKFASANLLYALTRDTDHSVRMTAVAYTPLIGFEEQAQVDAAIKYLSDLAKTSSFHTRYEAIVALTYCGPIAKDAIPVMIGFCIVDPNSWQIRRAACACLGSIGRGEAGADGKVQGPSWNAVMALATRAQRDVCVEVRREALHSIMVLTPPVDTFKDLNQLRQLLALCKRDLDKGVSIWARVALLRIETDRIKESNPNFKEVIAFLRDKDPVARLEAIQAIGQLGDEVAGPTTDLLISLVNADDDAACKAAAIWALVPMAGVADQVVKFLEKVKQSHKDANIRKAAEDALVAIATGKNKEEVQKKEPPKKKDPVSNKKN